MPESSRAPSIRSQQPVNNCHVLPLTEENIRFMLLGLILYLYLCMGAFIFQALEEDPETEMREGFFALYYEFRQNLTLLNEEVGLLHDSNTEFQEKYPPFQISEDDLLRLLYAYGNATKAGVFQRQHWDWVGSFHFAWTIVSTIGYGEATPNTIPGKLLTIPYGFFGCAGGLLFFNLFLERIITFLTTCMKCYRRIRQRRTSESRPHSVESQHSRIRNGGSGGADSAQSGMNPPSTDTPVGEEKPSVSWVMACLMLMSAIMISTSAVLFHEAEGWTYVESIYFAFVTYATIGFGDLVILQQDSLYGSETLEILYRIAAFAVVVLGCCCIYSLLNVTSIVIKRFLNSIMSAFDWPWCVCCRCVNTRLRRTLSSRRRRTLRDRQLGGASVRSGTQIAIVRIRGGSESGHHHSIDVEDIERRSSGENLVSLRRELSNKVSMAVIQKRLYETSHNHRTHLSESENEFSVRSVGPLAIASEKLEDNSL